MDDNEEPGTCPRCHEGEAQESHACPFKRELHDDEETLCNCCKDCEHQCCQDI